MAKAERSGLKVARADVPIILGMVKRGDRRHDVAAWFGLNQGRIKEVEDGKHGLPNPAPESHLPPSGSPGLKAKRIRESMAEIRNALKKGATADIKIATDLVVQAIAQFDKNE